LPFLKTLPEWNKLGVEPPQSLKDAGWEAEQKPPADYFNWFFNTVYLALKELQESGYTKEEITNLLNGKSATSHTHIVATQIVAGFMAAGDKAKLDGIQSGAQVNKITSVNDKTGAVTLGAADVGAMKKGPITWNDLEGI
jgi:hypothetical protein